MADPLDSHRLLRAPAPHRDIEAPTWDGSDPAGQTFLVHCDTDLDECVRLARYLPLLTGRRAKVLLDCPATLVRLLGRLPGVRVIAEGDGQPPVDAQVSLGALPLLFGTTPATVPTFSCYLRPGAELVATWRDRLRPARGDGSSPYLVGLAPAGGVSADPLTPFAPVPGVHCVSIQHGSATAPVRNPASASQVGKLPHTLNDLADIAAVIACVDLVIATNSVVAHLAGALGKPVWALLPFDANWCGSTVGDDTAWYASMRLLRQTAPGDWSDVLDAVSQALRSRFPAGISVAA